MLDFVQKEERDTISFSNKRQVGPKGLKAYFLM